MISLWLAEKNLLKKQERSILTIIGVILAVASFVALLSIAEGLNVRLRNEVFTRNVDLYILPNSANALSNGPISSILGSSDSISVLQNIPNHLQTKYRSRSDFKRISKSVGNIVDFLNDQSSEASMNLNIKKAIGISRVEQNIAGRSIVFIGMPFERPDENGNNSFKSFFPSAKPLVGLLPIATSDVKDPYGVSWKRTTEDLTEFDKKFVAGSKIAKEMNFEPGITIPVKGMTDNVPLISSCTAAFSSGFQDYFCYIPIQTAMTIDDSHGKVKEIWVQLKDKSKLQETKKLIKYNFPDLIVKTDAEYQSLSHELIQYAWILQFAIALIGVLIAITASMNTMLMSAFERVREFGALRSIGASRMTIASMILFESLILSMSGGVIGIIVGILGSNFLDSGVKVLFQTVFPMASITPNLILYAILLSVVIGILGAIMPAIILFRTDIIKMLKWE